MSDNTGEAPSRPIPRRNFLKLAGATAALEALRRLGVLDTAAGRITGKEKRVKTLQQVTDMMAGNSSKPEPSTDFPDTVEGIEQSFQTVKLSTGKIHSSQAPLVVLVNREKGPLTIAFSSSSGGEAKLQESPPDTDVLFIIPENGQSVSIASKTSDDPATEIVVWDLGPHRDHEHDGKINGTALAASLGKFFSDGSIWSKLQWIKGVKPSITGTLIESDQPKNPDYPRGFTCESFMNPEGTAEALAKTVLQHKQFAH